MSLGLTVVALAACLCTAGCGGSSSSSTQGSSGSSAHLTRAQLIAAADPICAHYLVELHAHPLKKVSEFTQELGRLSSNHQAELSALRKLKPPPELAPDWTEFISGQESLSRSMAQALGDAKDGDLRAVAPMVASGERVQAATVAIARRDGFKDCSRVR